MASGAVVQRNEQEPGEVGRGHSFSNGFADVNLPLPGVVFFPFILHFSVGDNFF